MASTVPAKSQPLHNFTLPHLKWNKDGHSSGHHHRRRSVKSPSRRPNTPSESPIRQSLLRDSVSATPPRYQSSLRDPAAPASPRESPVHGNQWGKQSVIRGESSKPESVRDGVKRSPVYGGDAVRHSPSRDVVSESETLARSKVALIEHRRMNSNSPKLNSARDRVYSTNSERASQKLETKSKAKEVDGAGIKRSKILIKIPCKNNNVEEENRQEEPLKIGNNGDDGETDEVLEEGKIENSMDKEIKTWNLRPRKPIRKSLNISGGTVKNSSASAPAKNKALSPLRNLPKRSGEIEGKSGEKKTKRRLSISVALSKEDIEEDIFALTGSKPARRPKKRAKNIQKQVDSVFPGLWLVGITAESYKVSENSLTG